MSPAPKLEQALRALEERLLDPAIRGSANQVDLLLADEFVEFGSSGHIYDKPAVMEALQLDPGFDGRRTIGDFRVRDLAPTVALVTYQIRETGTLRSSIWRLEEEQWRMVFHQGTARATG